MIVREHSGRGEAVSKEYLMTSETHPIYSDFVPEEHTSVPGRLGMTFAPSMKALGQRGRWDRVGCNWKHRFGHGHLPDTSTTRNATYGCGYARRQSWVYRKRTQANFLRPTRS